MSKLNEFKIAFGIMEPSLVSQINEQGLSWIPAEVAHFEYLRTCINRLYFSKIITDAEKSKAQRKLFKKILSNLSKQNK